MGDIAHGSTQTCNTRKNTSRENKIFYLVRKAREKALWVKCLPCNRAVPSPVSRTLVEMLRVAVNPSNPRAGLAEMGVSLGSLDHQPSIHGEFQAWERPCLKSQGGQSLRNIP